MFKTRPLLTLSSECRIYLTLKQLCFAEEKTEKVHLQEYFFFNLLRKWKELESQIDKCKMKSQETSTLVMLHHH